LFLRLIGLWIMVACWWGIYLRDDFQPYTAMINRHLTWMLPLAILLIAGSLLKKNKNNPQKHGIIPLLYGTILILLTAGIALILASIFVSLTAGYPTLLSSFLAHQVSYVLRLAGFNNTVANGAILLEQKKVLLDLIKSGVYQTVAFFLVFSALACIISMSWKKRLRLLFVGVVWHYIYLICYIAYMVILVPNEMSSGMGAFNFFLWKKMWLRFLPLLFLWAGLLWDFRHAVLLPKSWSFINLSNLGALFLSGKKQPVLWGLVFLFGISLGLSGWFWGFGKKTETTILIDEIHSKWEPTLGEFNQNEFGLRAENNYHMFLDYISRFHKTYVVTDDKVKSSISRVTTLHANKLSRKLFEAMPGKTILILKCFTKEPSTEEVKAVVSFVRNGGCVLFIGDHTDVFFMDTYLNKISTKFGLEFLPNAVYVATGGWPVTDKRNMRYHPITHHLDKFVWATSDALRLSGPAFPVVFSPLASYTDQANYFNTYFFGDTMIRPENSMGLHPIVAAARYGKGKVVAFTDSTCFNNELFFTVDKWGFLTGVFNWFSFSDAFNLFLVLAVILCVIIFIFLLHLSKRGFVSAIFLYSLLLWGLVGLLTGWLTAISLNNLVYQKEQPRVELPKQVLLDAAHKPASFLTMGNMSDYLGEKSSERFIYHLGRTKYYPQINYRHQLTEEKLQALSCLIIATPDGNFTAREKKDITSFVEKGGGLLLLEEARFKTTINQIAGQFGLHFRKDPHTLPIENTFLVNPTYVEGGEPLLIYQNIPVISYTRYGKGLVMAFGDAGSFTNKGKGMYTEKIVWMLGEMIEALGEGNEQALRSIDWQLLVAAQGY